jgi:hypothetical protein
MDPGEPRRDPMTKFNETTEGQDFIASAASRETSSEIMTNERWTCSDTGRAIRGRAPAANEPAPMVSVNDNLMTLARLLTDSSEPVTDDDMRSLERFLDG